MNLVDNPSRVIKMLEEIEDYAILLLDVDGNIESWNKGAEKIKGYKSEEVLGRNFRMFYTQEDVFSGKPERMINEAINFGKATDEGWRVCKNGSRFWGSISLTAIHDDEDNIIGFSKITKDLTDQLRSENSITRYTKKLELQNKELEQFVYIASHDLQEPLLTVINFIELLKEEYAGTLDETGDLYLNFISQSTNRMRSLIKGLLDYARLGKKREIKDVDCSLLVNEIKSDLFLTIERCNGTIIFDNLPSVKGYATELRQLFQNLISNALKFRNKDIAPIVIVSSVKTNQGWKFSVSDNGIGIDERFREKIFVIFQRLHNRSDYEGNGIGLAHCKKIAELHGGDITFESSPGKGSVFHFTLNLDTVV